MTHDSADHARAHEAPSAAIDRLAAELEGVERRGAGGAVEFALGGAVFAVREGSVHSFWLRAEIVGAGLRTPATARTSRGPEWIALRSDEADDFTLDRARAWFELAWRLAGGGPPRPDPAEMDPDEDDEG
jgi:hypothetical protein